MAIDRQHCEVFRHRLRDKHAVEGIAVVMGKGADGVQMFKLDRQYVDACLPQDVRKIIPDIEFAQALLYCDFPKRGDTGNAFIHGREFRLTRILD